MTRGARAARGSTAAAARWALTSVLALGPVACVPRAQTPVVLADPTAREWTRLRERLAISRDGTPDKPYVEQIVVAMREPRTKRVFQARGAVAVDPRRALRMILVGPGGATALDVWVTDARFRFAAPAVDFARRGGAEPSEARGLPVGFLRWWLLHPLDGRLLAAWNRNGEPLYLLRRGEDTVVMRDTHVPHTARHHVVAARHEEGSVERLEWLGRSPSRPHAGDKARYVDVASGLEVEVLIESVSADEPDPAAFLDPDAVDAADPKARAL